MQGFDEAIGVEQGRIGAAFDAVIDEMLQLDLVRALRATTGTGREGVVPAVMVKLLFGGISLKVVRCAKGCSLEQGAEADGEG